MFPDGPLPNELLPNCGVQFAYLDFCGMSQHTKRKAASDVKCGQSQKTSMKKNPVMKKVSN